MRVLVTGAAGFLGCAVVEAFAARGHDVRGLVRPSTKVDGLWGAPVDVVRADLASRRDSLEGVFDGVDALVHLAAVLGGEEAAQFSSTVVGTERLLESMARSDCRRVVLASSTTVYDWSAPQNIITETSPLTTDLDGRGGYTRAKVWQERVARRLAEEHSFALTVMRPGILWGPLDPCPTGLSLSLGRTHLVFGHGALPLTFLYNCADAFVAVTESDATAGSTFNVVDPTPAETAWFVNEHLRRTGTPGSTVTVPWGLGLSAVRVAGALNRVMFESRGRLPSVLVPARYLARFRPLRFSSAALEEQIGWRPPYDLGTALEMTYDHAAHP